MAALPDELFDELQRDADAAGQDPSQSSSWNRPVLNRLRDYVSIVLTPLNMRVRTVALAAVAPQRILVKISAIQNLALVFAPHEMLAAEVYLRRVAQQKHLPFPAVIRSDLSYNTLPVGYMMSAYIGGHTLAAVEDEALQRVGARQIGRTLRVLHGNPAAGIGAPQPDGQWKQSDWRSAVRNWLQQSGHTDALAAMIGPHIAQRFWERWVAGAPESLTHAVVLHGDLDPRHASVSVSSHIQLEGLEGAGMLVGGDAMYDVAASMRGRFHPEFRNGFVEGYTAAGPLSADEIARVKHYLLGYRVIDALQTPGLDRDAFAQSIQHALQTLGA